MSSGVKSDSAKPDFTVLVDPNLATPTLIESFRGLRDVVAYGAAKYSQDGWLDVLPNNRYLAACLRHLIAFQSGEIRDPESGLPHLDHALCSLLFFVEKTRRTNFLNEVPNVSNVTTGIGEKTDMDLSSSEKTPTDGD